MQTHEIGPLIAGLLSELVDGAAPGGDAYILNSGDAGLLRSLDKLDAGEASRSTNGGATIAAHAQHVRYGLSLMNRWSREGASAFANPAWDEPWKISTVDEAAWCEIRDGLRGEAQRWSGVLTSPREVTAVELTGLMSSVAHLAYHLGAIRQINKDARGPKEGTFPNPRDASA
jgi:hypothetical protein